MFIIYDDCALKDLHDTFQPQEVHNLSAILRESNATQTTQVSLTSRTLTSASFNFIHLSLYILLRNGTKKVPLSGVVNFHGKSEYSTLVYTTQEYCFWRALINCLLGHSPDRYHFPYSSRIEAKDKIA